MSFVASPAAPQSPANSTVTAGEWWPEINCNALRAAMRLGDVVTHERLLEAIRGALITVTRELKDWRATKVAAGAENLAAVDPESQIDGTTELEVLFVRAVRFSATAELFEGHRDVSTTNEQINRADAELVTAADFRRAATHAIRDILGTTRTAVELI